jgi:hypothetical protein
VGDYSEQPYGLEILLTFRLLNLKPAPRNGVMLTLRSISRGAGMHASMTVSGLQDLARGSYDALTYMAENNLPAYVADPL